MERENKFREFRYFPSLQSRKFIPRKYLPAKISFGKVVETNYMTNLDGKVSPIGGAGALYYFEF